MQAYFSQKLNEIQLELEAVDMDSSEISIDDSLAMIHFLEKSLSEIKTYLLSQNNLRIEDEIYFFKEVKPEVLGFLLYFNKIHTIELKCPNGSNNTLRDYYQKELNSLTYFFERNLDFYQYYRSKSTHLDEYYFLRNKQSHQLCLDSAHFIIDHDFSTGYDYKIAKIISNEMLRIYLNKKTLALDKQSIINKNRAGNHDFYFENETITRIQKMLSANSYYLCDTGITIEGINFWGSPITPTFFNWAFNRDRGKEIAKYWSKIPKNTDILITHGPPFGILDQTKAELNVGCEDLLKKVKLIKPKYHLFGHIHEAYGRYQNAHTTFYNGSTLDENYTMTNKPIIIEI